MVRTYDAYGYPFEPVELYDMVGDPYQTRNLCDKEPAIVDRCSRYMADWTQAQWGKGHCIPDPLLETLRERAGG
jgi:hypothetical protein